MAPTQEAVMGAAHEYFSDFQSRHAAYIQTNCLKLDIELQGNEHSLNFSISLSSPDIAQPLRNDNVNGIHCSTYWRDVLRGHRDPNVASIAMDRAFAEWKSGCINPFPEDRTWSLEVHIGQIEANRYQISSNVGYIIVTNMPDFDGPYADFPDPVMENVPPANSVRDADDSLTVKEEPETGDQWHDVPRSSAHQPPHRTTARERREGALEAGVTRCGCSGRCNNLNCSGRQEGRECDWWCHPDGDGRLCRNQH